MTTTRTPPPVSPPEQAIASAGSPIRVRLPVGGWQVGFRIQPDGRTVIEVTDQDESLTGLMTSTRLPITSIDAGWSGLTRDPAGGRHWWALAIGHVPADAGQPTVTFTRRTRHRPGAAPPDAVDGLWFAHDGLWVAAATGHHTLARLTTRSATQVRRLRPVHLPQSGGSLVPDASYAFLGPGGGHFRRSGYGERFFRPAADGWYPRRGKRPSMPVLVDASCSFPGRPVAPWPAVTAGEPFAMPAGRGITRLASDERTGRCPQCGRAIGSAWRLTAAQRGRLAPAVDAALRAGWTPAELAAFTGANTGGVRNPYAVLAARLSPDELPGPTGREGWWRQPPWCGECNRRTRRREDADGADAGRCPLCHPLASTARRAGGDDPDTGRRAAAGRGWQADETGPLPGSRAASPQRQHAARNLNYQFAG